MNKFNYPELERVDTEIGRHYRDSNNNLVPSVTTVLSGTSDNKDGIQRLGNLWEYTDEKAFVDCQLLFREAEQRFNKTEIPQKLFSNRGVILHDVYF